MNKFDTINLTDSITVKKLKEIINNYSDDTLIQLAIPSVFPNPNTGEEEPVYKCSDFGKIVPLVVNKEQKDGTVKTVVKTLGFVEYEGGIFIQNV